MCRFLVFKGTEPILLSHLVTRPLNSIVNQTFDSRLRFESPRPFNADGFGLGWYEDTTSVTPVDSDHHGHGHDGGNGLDFRQDSTPSASALLSHVSTAKQVMEKKTGSKRSPDPLQDGETTTSGGGLSTPQLGLERVSQPGQLEAKLAELAEERERPCIFKAITPAWSNANLTRLAEKIRSPLVFAHVRASTMPGAPSEENCHPWSFGKLMWMHNGEISQFPRIKRGLQALLSEELFLFPQGHTDSEWAFALFLSKLRDPHASSFTSVELRKAMVDTIASINQLSKQAGSDAVHRLNFCVSDGENVVATRYVSSRTLEATSLFFSSGTTFEEYAPGGHYRMLRADKRENIIMIASEPLTFEQQDWMVVRNNHMVVITPKMNVLQIPIIDEFALPAHLDHQRTSKYEFRPGDGLNLSSPSSLQRHLQQAVTAM